MSRTATLARLRRLRPVVAPSMLKCDFGNLHREIELLESAGAEALHWDVMDGHFVPNLSYGALLIEKVRPRTELIFDAHLMISRPEQYVEEYMRLGCEAITIHVEATRDPRSLLKRIAAEDCVAGLAINPETPVEQALPLLEVCDLVLVMSVSPGFGGQRFQPAALDKARRLRKEAGPELLLSIDGGIGPQTIGPAALAGVDMYVVGSAIFDRPDYRDALAELTALAEQPRAETIRQERN